MIKKIVSGFLCVTLTVLCAFISSSTATADTGLALVTGSDVGIRADATTGSAWLGSVTFDYVTVTGQKQGTDNEYIWYAVTYNGISGYTRSDFIKLINQTQDPAFEGQISDFPESYKPYLRKLHAVYPNWVFRADKLKMSFDEAVYNEDKYPRKLVNLSSDGVSFRSMGKDSFNWVTGTWSNTEGGWTGASTELIAYYMDPRNFLNPTYIYSYMTVAYSPTLQTAEGLDERVSGTFLANGYSDPEDPDFGGSYINVIMEAARQSDVSPYVLAATIIQEQGNSGESALVSGASSYGKYFNFFNIGATGSTDAAIIANGLNYAKNSGWTTRSASIIGGAKKYAESYVNSGQDTYFNKNFDLLNEPFYTFQYAQDIHNTFSLGRGESSNYAKLFDAKLNFRIPVYTAIPDEVCKKPEENGRLNNYYILSADIQGFDKYNFNYSFAVAGDTTINTTLHEGATLTTPRKNTLSVGTNIISVTVKSQTGYTRTYTLNITASVPCVLTIPNGTESGDGGGEVIATKRGDTNGDGAIDVIDLAAVRLHMLSIKPLSGNPFAAADTNSDGLIDVIDLAAVRLHMLKIKPLG